MTTSSPLLLPDLPPSSLSHWCPPSLSFLPELHTNNAISLLIPYTITLQQPAHQQLGAHTTMQTISGFSRSVSLFWPSRMSSGSVSNPPKKEKETEKEEGQGCQGWWRAWKGAGAERQGWWSSKWSTPCD